MFAETWASKRTPYECFGMVVVSGFPTALFVWRWASPVVAGGDACFEVCGCSTISHEKKKVRND